MKLRRTLKAETTAGEVADLAWRRLADDARFVNSCLSHEGVSGSLGRVKPILATFSSH